MADGTFHRDADPRAERLRIQRCRAGRLPRLARWSRRLTMRSSSRTSSPRLSSAQQADLRHALVAPVHTVEMHDGVAAIVLRIDLQAELAGTARTCDPAVCQARCRPRRPRCRRRPSGSRRVRPRDRAPRAARPICRDPAAAARPKDRQIPRPPRSNPSAIVPYRFHLAQRRRLLRVRLGSIEEATAKCEYHRAPITMIATSDMLASRAWGVPVWGPIWQLERDAKVSKYSAGSRRQESFILRLSSSVTALA